MLEIIDVEIWGGLLALTAIMYLIRFWQSRNRKKIYRISAESLNRSKEVMLRVLPLVEDDSEKPLNEDRLPYPKESIKSAAKILAYYYWKEQRNEELARVKHCFIALSRFQDQELESDLREKRLLRDKKKLTQEFETYLTHSPHRNGKAA